MLCTPSIQSQLTYYIQFPHHLCPLGGERKLRARPSPAYRTGPCFWARFLALGQANLCMGAETHASVVLRKTGSRSLIALPSKGLLLGALSGRTQTPINCALVNAMPKSWSEEGRGRRWAQVNGQRTKLRRADKTEYRSCLQLGPQPWACVSSGVLMPRRDGSPSLPSSFSSLPLHYFILSVNVRNTQCRTLYVSPSLSAI